MNCPIAFARRFPGNPRLLRCFVLCLCYVISACSGEVGAQSTVSLPPVAATASNEEITSVINENERFNNFKLEFLEDYFALYPTEALFAGRYENDSRLEIHNEEQRRRIAEHSGSVIAALQGFDTQKLEAGNTVDYYLIMDEMRRAMWSLHSFKDWAWNPSNYNVAGAFGLILNTEYKPLNERLQTFYLRMENVPAYYQAARNNLAAVSEPHLRLAIQQNRGAVGVFDATFRDLVN
jgi:uncharacterized protein (DUF885 family)